MHHKLHTDNPTALQVLFTEDLYQVTAAHTLAEVPTKAVEENKTTYFEYIGENNAYFLLLIEDNTQASIHASMLDTLLKIMQAKGLTLKDLAIVNYANYSGVSFDDLKAFFACTRLALFGIDPQQLQLPPLAANQPESIRQVKVMATYSLSEMETNLDKKRQFWSVMKNF